jgi:hypothetical protein
MAHILPVSPCIRIQFKFTRLKSCWCHIGNQLTRFKLWMCCIFLPAQTSPFFFFFFFCLRYGHSWGKVGAILQYVGWSLDVGPALAQCCVSLSGHGDHSVQFWGDIWWWPLFCLGVLCLSPVRPVHKVQSYACTTSYQQPVSQTVVE